MFSKKRLIWSTARGRPALKFLPVRKLDQSWFLLVRGTVADRFSGSGGRSRVEILEPGLGKDC